MTQPVVAILGTRYADFSVEEEALGPAGAELVAGDGGSPAEIVAVAAAADVVLAGSRPRFTADVVAGLRLARRRPAARHRPLRHRHRLHRPRRRPPARRRRGPGVRLRHRGGRLPRGRDGAGPAAPAGRGRPRAARRAVGRGRPAAAAPAQRAGRRRRRLRPDRPPGRALPARVRHAGVRPRRVRRRGGRARRRRRVARRAAGAQRRGHAARPRRRRGRPLLGADQLARMRPGSVLVNTARGSLVDLDALAAGWPPAARPAALDVFPPSRPRWRPGRCSPGCRTGCC